MKSHANNTLDSFIRERITPLPYITTTTTDELNGFKLHIKMETEAQIEEMQIAIGQLDTEKKVELFVHHQQSHYTDLINQVMGYAASVLEVNPSNNHLATFYQEVIVLLDRVLGFMEREYSKYLDYAREMPLNRLNRVKMEVGNRVAILRQRLTTDNTEMKLLDLSLAPYELLVNTATKGFTYQQYFYCKQYLDELETIKADEDIDCRLRTILVFMNFNSRQFLDYCYDNINSEIRALKTTAEKLDKLEELTKIFTQLQTKPNCQYTPSRANTVSFLCGLIKAEKKHIRKQKKIYALYNPAAKEEAGNKSLRLKTKYNLPTFTTLIRAFMLAGIFDNDVQQDVIKILAPLIQTPSRDVITIEGMRKQFYSITPESKNNATDILHLAIKFMREI